MYTVLNERYLKFELFNGYDYSEGLSEQKDLGGKNSNNESLTKTKFSKMQVVFDLSSFQLQTTDKKWFQGNRIMRNLSELDTDIDSVSREVLSQRLNHYLYKPTYFSFYMKKDSVIMPKEVYKQKLFRDSVARIPYAERSRLERSKKDSIKNKSSIAPRRDSTDAIKSAKLKKEVASASVQRKQPITKQPVKRNLAPIATPKTTSKVMTDSARQAKVDSILNKPLTRETIQGATNLARQVKSQVMNANLSIDNFQKELAIFQIQWHKILANSFACIAMFLIGAPLGAIIKKGGLGVPFLVSIFFFIIYYVITMQGEKLAKQETVSVAIGVWAADGILLIIGLIFLRQARIDARLFEADFYSVVMDKVKRWMAEKRRVRSGIA
jgi:lipopolysaccharide export system permease protein